MAIITDNIENDNQKEQRISDFLKEFRVNAVLRRFGADREKGYPLKQVWAFIFSLVFSGRNLYRTVNSDKYDGMGKDVIYRFLNSVKIHWERVLLVLALSVICRITPLTSETRRNAIVVDDTCFYRDRSKMVELICKGRDHSKDQYYKGYRMLTLGWTDGVDFIPYAFQLMSSSDPDKRICESKPFL